MIQTFGNPKPQRQRTLLANDRVKALLVALYYGRYYTPAQLQALFWRRPDGSLPNSLRATQQKLQDMRVAGLIRVVKQRVQKGEGDLPYLYALDKAGALLVSQHLGIDYAGIDWKPKALEENYLFLQHLLETHNLYIAMTMACAKHALQLRSWTYETALRSKERIDYVELKVANDKIERLAVIPDSFCILETPRGLGHFAIEIDRGTAALTRWKQKIQAYHTYHASGAYQKRYNARNFRLLTITSTVQRLQHIKEATEKVAPNDARFWFTTFEQVTTKTPLFGQRPGLQTPTVKRYKVLYNDDILTAPVWYRTGSDKLHAILE